METKNITGYPSIDKPWNKYYQKDKIHLDKSKSIYQHFKDVTKKKADQLVYVEQGTGLKLTYKELLDQADNLAAALQKVSFGIKRVGLLSFYSDFEPAVILASNKIGALVKVVSPDLNVKELSESISELDILFADGCFAMLEKVISAAGIPVVWNSDTLVADNKKYYLYKELFFKADDHQVNSYDYKENEPAFIIYSSGTTGVAKPIVHSNASVLFAIEKMLNSDFPINSDNYILKVIPSHIGLGSVTTMLTSMLGGSTCITIKPQGFDQPPFAALEIIKNYRKFVAENGLDLDKGLIMFASPLFSMVVYQFLNEIDDLSFFNGILLAGAKMEKEQLEMLTKAFESKGLSVPLCNGYGQNEMCGAITLNTVHHNQNGSAGYPVKEIDICVIDPKTHMELPYDTEGLIVERSESSFLYYDKMPKKTASAKILMPDGAEWFNTTDLGYIDREGFLHVTGRTTRVIIRTDHKVSLDYLEEKIRNMEHITDAAVISSDDGSVITALIVSDNEVKKSKLIDLIDNCGEFSMWDKPERILAVEKIPYMKNGKIDYMTIKNLVEKEN